MENKITNADKEQTLKCKNADCKYHVHYIPKKPLPGFGLVVALKEYDKKTVYLTCDNPETPHTNGYQINF